MSAHYNPRTHHGKGFIALMWGVPTIFMLILASVMWTNTHRLEPKKVIAHANKPITIQVIAQQWKWLFIYPDSNIATVNFVQLPVNTPVTFELTADNAPMSSFWIPHLGGQLYAMTGHVNRLNLIAETTGDYPGASAEINGHGFAGMKFTTRVDTKESFDQWVADIQATNKPLNESAYIQLLKPSENNQVVFYSSVKSDLYTDVLQKYMGGHGHGAESTSHGSSSHGASH